MSDQPKSSKNQAIPSDEQRELVAQIYRAYDPVYMGAAEQILVERDHKIYGELRKEIINQKIQNNHNWQFQEISEEALARAGVAETKLAGIRAAVMEACENAEIKVLFLYPENTNSRIHPNKLSEIYKSQTTECMVAIAKVFDKTT